jgi:hypothetical protein
MSGFSRKCRSAKCQAGCNATAVESPGEAMKVVYGGADKRDGEVDMYDWGPTGLRVFQAPNPEGDVAAIKAGNVSITALRAGFMPHA